MVSTAIKKTCIWNRDIDALARRKPVIAKPLEALHVAIGVFPAVGRPAGEGGVVPGVVDGGGVVGGCEVEEGGEG